MNTMLLPRIVRLRQQFADDRIADLERAVRAGIEAVHRSRPLPRGAKVAVTAGSRGIRHIADILKYAVQALKALDCEPYLISAMGSHGGGTAEGQEAVLRSLGIVEEAVGAPVIASAETRKIGLTAKRDTAPAYSALCTLEGLPVYVAKEALEADAVLVVNRVKPHTSFHGDYESGLMKMLAVGLGRAPGADSVHRAGAARLAEAIPSVAAYILTHVPVWGGLAIVENSEDAPALIEGVPADRFPAREKELLALAKRYMPSIPVRNIDLCLIGEMGKNYSGTGMDTNVIGRLKITGVGEPEEPGIRYLGVLGLSEASHGNATGIGLADFTTRRVAEQIDWEATYLNCLTSGFTARAALPIVAEDDRDVLKKAMFALKTEHPDRLRLVILKNTLHLDELWVSEALIEEVRDRPGLVVEGEPFPLTFDGQGRLSLFAS